MREGIEKGVAWSLGTEVTEEKKEAKRKKDRETGKETERDRERSGHKNLPAFSEEQQERESRNRQSLSRKGVFCACIQTTVVAYQP